MKILFVNPPSPDGFVYIRDTNRSGRRSAERTIWPQTSLAMFASVLPEHDVKILDCLAEGTSYKMLFEQMKEFAPAWVIFNPISSIFVHDMIVAHFAKSLNAKTVIISPHATALTEEVYGQYPSLDHVIRYKPGDPEPEWMLRELITGQRSDGNTLSDIPPARHDLLPTERYSLPFIGKKFSFVVTSRGCPYKCIYCRQGVMYGGSVRHRSVDSVIAEIVKYGLKNIALHSDTATLNKEWMYEFCRKIPFGVRWVCNSRVDTVDSFLLKRMEEKGCWMICYGIESGDDKVLALNRKGANCAQAEQAVKWTKEAGIKVWGYFMLGLFGDTYESMQRTISFACDLPIDIANFAISCPYPGTEWNKLCGGKGWISGEGDFDQNFSAIVSQPDCPASLVKQMQRRAYLKYYLSWRGVRLAFQSPRAWGFLIHVAADHFRSIFKKTARPNIPLAGSKVGEL